MRITLGLELDGGSYPDALGSAEACVGRVVTGPRGLVSVLETRMGLSAKEEPEGVRIGQYSKRLQNADDGKRFYSDSFKADAWSVAKQLLEWRDELVSHGWRGDVLDRASNRLKDLARIEKLHSCELAPGFSDRLLQVTTELSNAKDLGISEIRCVEPIDDWPPFWQSVLTLLAKAGVAISNIPPSGNAEKTPREKVTDLARLKAALRNNQPDNSGIQGDGSLVLVRSDVEGDTAELLSSWLAKKTKEHKEILFIRGNGSNQLCNGFHSRNLPCIGWESRSQWRTALQVLPLVLSNLWRPFDPQRLLEILMLPKSPIPRSAATFFEAALREHPGNGGPLWQKAWDAAVANYAARHGKENGKANAQGNVEQFKKQLLFWLGELRYDPSRGMPAGVVSEICSQVRQWAATRGALDEDGLLAASASMADEVARAVTATGMDFIPKAQLDRILDSVVGAGLEHPCAYPEASAWSLVTSPGQIWGNVSHIVWLDFVDTGRGTFSSTWSDDENALLSSVGVSLERPQAKRMRHSRTWLRPVLHANDKLTLIVPGSIVSESQSLHPLWDEIRYFLHMKEADEGKMTTDASTARKTPRSHFLGTNLDSEPVSERPLPLPAKEWGVANPRILVRDKESPTSMEMLIACPLSWVLNYILKLERGRLASLPDAKQMIGSLAHAVIENLFKQSTPLNPTEAAPKAGEIFDNLIPQMAAQLLQPGWELERERCRKALGTAASRLAVILADAGLKVAGCEVEMQKDLRPGRKFVGRIDMVLQGKGRRELFLDLKWSGSSKYRYQEIREGLSLQLAAYGWLLSERDATFPPGGYYMLAQGELFAAPCRFLPEIHIVRELDLEEVWRRALEGYDSRLKELKRGRVLATGLAGEGDENDPPDGHQPGADPFALAPKCNWCDYKNLCGAQVE